MMRRTVARPMPVPSKSAAECSRWNTPNNLSAYFMSKPAPLSRTMKARPPFASTEANWTRGCGCFAVYFQRSEEHTSELQSRLHLVCRLLLEKKKYKSERRPTRQIRPDALPAIADAIISLLPEAVAVSSTEPLVKQAVVSLCLRLHEAVSVVC